jgi:O-antigen/teichoic acid export membrane protein
MAIFNRLKNFVNEGQERSVIVKKNVLLSFLNKGISIIVSLLLVPVTINYVNPEQYGIWLTLSSIVIWIRYFDFGLGHGFRNKFAEAKAKGDIILARKYVSTSFFLLTGIVVLLFVIAAFVNGVINWGKALNVDASLNAELTNTFFVVLCFFCLNMILEVFKSLLLADMKTAFASMIGTIGNLLALIVIYVLTKTTIGSLFYLAFALSGIPCMVLLFMTVYMFLYKYKDVSPRRQFVDFSLTKDILGLGTKFFLIQMSTLVIFQFVNVILLRIEGSTVVTQYNIAFKYFNVLFMGYMIVLLPIWSAFTEAYTQNDSKWMYRAYKKLSKIWVLMLFLCFVMVLVSPLAYHLWLQNSVEIPFSLSIMVAVYVMLLSRAHMYMNMINGTSKIQLQMYIYLCASLFSMPLMVVLCKQYGAYGVLWVMSAVYVLQIVGGHIQLLKLVKRTVHGIWNK